MAKIVVVYHVDADWGSSYEVILSFNYDSPEAWLIDFEKCLTNLVNKKKLNWESCSNEFTFCDKLFDAYYFCNMSPKKTVYKLPSVYSLDEWFEKNLHETVNSK